MLTTVPQQDAGHLDQPQVVGGLLLVSDASDMRLVVVALHDFPSGLFIVALIQAQMLRSLLGGFGTLHHHGVERGFEQLEVRYVRSGYHRCQRFSVGSTRRERFTPFFPLSVGLGPIWSPQNEPCPSPRRPPATRSSLHQAPLTPR